MQEQRAIRIIYLGSNTELQRPGDSYTEKTLNKLGSVLRRNNELGLRDKYTMSEVSKIIMKMYRSRIDYYQKYIKGIRTPLFKRNEFCGNILADASSVMRTEKYNSIINTHIALFQIKINLRQKFINFFEL